MATGRGDNCATITVIILCGFLHVDIRDLTADFAKQCNACHDLLIGFNTLFIKLFLSECMTIMK